MTLRGGFVKQEVLKLGVKQRASNGLDEQSGESEKEQVMGEGIGELKMEELVPE